MVDHWIPLGRKENEKTLVSFRLFFKTRRCKISNRSGYEGQKKGNCRNVIRNSSWFTPRSWLITLGTASEKRKRESMPEAGSVDPRRILWLYRLQPCTNYNFRARDSKPILRITSSDSVVSRACTPSACRTGRGARGVGRFVPWILTKRGIYLSLPRVAPLVFTFPRRGIFAR